MTVYFLSPDYSFPSGGVRVIYRHVDLLNAHGIPAYVLHRKMGFRCDWFQNETPVAYVDSTFRRRLVRKLRTYVNPEPLGDMHLVGTKSSTISKEDILVLPEIFGPTMGQMAPGVPKVIFNQNCYLSFRGYPVDKNELRNPYNHPDLCAVLINSEDGEEYLRYAFPQAPITRFHLSINPELFAFRSEKKRQICFTPRKNKNFVQQVINILKLRGALRDFELVPFSGVSQTQVAKLMKESAIFLSFSQNEGFGLPPAEAMACGCIVIGFHAGGGREFLKPEFSYPIEDGDVLGFARTVEEVIRAYDAESERFAAMGKAASDFIRENYSPQREEEDIIGFWKGLLTS